MNSRIALPVGFVVFGMGMLALPVAAHHGWAGQSDTQTRVTGKVQRPVSLDGPHASLQIVVDGQVWDVTLAPPARTQNAGLVPSTLKVGEEITIQGNRNRDPKRFEMKTVRVTAGGRNYDVYPDRIK
jgi:Family of unknown function (DUF6152)